MADEVVSKLGLDASDVINTLNQLAAGFTKYTNALAESAGGTANFNTAQKSFVDLLARMEVQARLTAGAIKELNGGVASTGKQLAAAAATQTANAAAAAANQLKGQFDTSKATPDQLTAFTSALQTFQSRAAKAGVDAKTLNSIVANTGATFSGAAAGVNQAALNVVKLGQGFGQLPPTINNATQASNNFSFSLNRIVEVFAFQQVLRGFGALTGALASSVPAAIEFEKRIAAIATISDKSDQNLQTLSARIIGLANEFGKPAPEVAAGFYQALSNQVGNTDQTIQFFVASLQLARATLADVGDAVNALSGIQLSYAQSSAQAARNADILFTIVDLGRVSTKELGDSLGRITPIAAQLGVSLEEVGAAISVATQKGVNFRDAQTQILNLLTASLKPTGDFKKRLDELGFASTEAGIAALGAIGFFSKIGEGAKSSTELAKLFPNIRGLRGEISLFGDSGKAMAATLADIEARAGAASKAFEKIQFTNAIEVEAELNRIKNTLIAGFGSDVVAALALLNKTFGGLSGSIVTIAELLAGGIGIATTIVLVNQLAAAFVGLSAATGVAIGTLTSFGAVAVAALAAVTASVIAFRSTDFASQTASDFEKVRRETARFATEQAEIVRVQNLDLIKSSQATAAELISSEAQKQRAFTQATQLAIQLQKAETASFDNQLNQRLRAFTAFENAVRKIEDDNAQRSLNLKEAQRKTELDINQQQFERFNGQFNEQRQASNLQTRFAQLQNKAQTAFNAGDIKVGNDILQILGGIAKQYGDITGKTFLESRFIELNRIATQKQIELGDQQVAQAKALEAINQPIVNEAKRQVELAQELEKELEKAQKAGDAVRVDQLQQQIVGIAANIDKLSGKLTLGNLKIGDIKGTDVQNAADALRKAVGGIPLEFSAKQGFAKIAADAKAFFESDPIVIKGQFKFDAAGFAAEQQRVQDLIKTLTSGQNFEQALPGLQKNVADARLNLLKNFSDVQAAIDQAERSALSRPGLAGKPEQAAAEKAKFEQIKEDARKFQDDVQKILDNPLSFDKSGNLTLSALKSLGLILDNVRSFQKELDKQGSTFGEFLGKFRENFSKDLQATVDGVELLTKAIRTLKEAQDTVSAGNAARAELFNKAETQPNLGTPKDQRPQAAQELQEAVRKAVAEEQKLQSISNQVTENAVQNNIIQAQSIDNLINREDLLGESGLIAGQDAAGGISGIGSTALAQIPAIFALISALDELASASGGGGGGGGGEFASRGGMMFFANGGFAPRGKDTIPAFLSPGEFVMNPASSRKFFSQLVSMNAGVTPTFNANGGGVSNSFGDIHVNVTSGASGIDGREIASAIRRELRRRTTRL